MHEKLLGWSVRAVYSDWLRTLPLPRLPEGAGGEERRAEWVREWERLDAEEVCNRLPRVRVCHSSRKFELISQEFLAAEHDKIKYDIANRARWERRGVD